MSKGILKIIISNFFFINLTWAGVQMPKYDRSQYKHWTRKDGLSVRDRVLIEESLSDTKFNNCGDESSYMSGEWKGLYSGATFYCSNEIDIDHLVPLKEAHISGAYKWDYSKKKLYANDIRNPYTLIAVSSSQNRKKGSKDPSQWMPPNQDAHCTYLKMWIDVKSKWDLKMDEREENFINSRMENCN